MEIGSGPEGSSLTVILRRSVVRGTEELPRFNWWKICMSTPGVFALFHIFLINCIGTFNRSPLQNVLFEFCRYVGVNLAKSTYITSFVHERK